MQSSTAELQENPCLLPRSPSLCRPVCGDPWPLLGRARPPNGLPAFITVPCSDEDVIMDLGACMRVRADACVRPHHQRYVHMFTSVWSTQAWGCWVLCAGCRVQGAVCRVLRAGCRARWRPIRRCVLFYVSRTVFFKTIQENKKYKKRPLHDMTYDSD